jgi:hypothetical protein
MYNNSIVGKNSLNTFLESITRYSKFEYWVLLLSLILLRASIPLNWIPQLCIRFFSLALFIGIILFNIIYLLLRSNVNIYFNRPFFIFLAISVVVNSISFARSIISGIPVVIDVLFYWVNLISFGLFAFFVFVKSRNQSDSIRYREAIYYSLFLYVAFNCILTIIGWDPPEKYYKFFPSVMLQKLGILAYRTSFPTGSGINSFGIIGGATIVMGVILLISHPRSIEKIIGIIGMLLGLFVVFKTDSRGPLVYAIITVLLSIIPIIRSYSVLRWIPLLCPLFPFALVLTLRNFTGPFINSLSRSTSGEGVNSLLSGRVLIWNSYLDYFKNFQISHLLGSGYIGQQISGVSKAYSHLFQSWYVPEANSAHNFALQTIIETGYIGFFLNIVILFFVLYLFGKYLSRIEDHSVKVLFFLLIYMILTGTTESALTLDNQETYFILILIGAAAGSLQLVKENNKAITSIAKST